VVKFLGYTVVLRVSKPTINMETGADMYDWEEANGTLVAVGRNDIHKFQQGDVGWILAKGVKHTKPGRAVINKMHAANASKTLWVNPDTIFGNDTWRTSADSVDIQLSRLLINQIEANGGPASIALNFPNTYGIAVHNWPQPRNNVEAVNNNYSYGVEVKIYMHWLAKNPTIPTLFE